MSLRPWIVPVQLEVIVNEHNYQEAAETVEDLLQTAIPKTMQANWEIGMPKRAIEEEQ